MRWPGPWIQGMCNAATMRNRPSSFEVQIQRPTRRSRGDNLHDCTAALWWRGVSVFGPTFVCPVWNVAPGRPQPAIGSFPSLERWACNLCIAEQELVPEQPPPRLRSKHFWFVGQRATVQQVTGFLVEGLVGFSAELSTPSLPPEAARSVLAFLSAFSLAHSASFPLSLSSSSAACLALSAFFCSPHSASCSLARFSAAILS